MAILDEFIETKYLIINDVRGKTSDLIHDLI